ncbi:MAG: glutamate-1-semialdehyde 2,1-aminomutase [Bryobacterales bacterium]|nr:glutamate-1-semialdehyde 2,1-aminomutase [Bryobacterales bacterium]
MNTSRSEQLFARARKTIPGGVNSPVRAFRSVGGIPRFIERGEGCYVEDADGNRYIDYVGSWGPLILGHRPPAVIEAIREVLESGTSFGAPTEREIELAEELSAAVPALEMVRLVNSGTEAMMSALRVARGFTGRDLTIKFEGCYHGHVDSLLVKAGSGLATFGISDSGGVPRTFAETTISVPFNNLDAVAQAFSAHPGKIACVAVEPVAGNMGCIPPAPGFLEGLRELCTKNGALLVFDEVMTGFRVAYGGAQVLYNIRPDLSAFGKVIGGGLPIAAYGGSVEVMNHIAPNGPVYQAGTLSGNPLAVAAGLATLRELKRHPELYQRLEENTAALTANPPEGVTVNRAGSMFTFFLTAGPVTDFRSAQQSDTATFMRLFHWMLEHGVYMAPSQFEAGFVSTAHGRKEIDITREAMAAFFEQEAHG